MSHAGSIVLAGTYPITVIHGTFPCTADDGQFHKVWSTPHPACYVQESEESSCAVGAFHEDLHLQRHYWQVGWSSMYRHNAEGEISMWGSLFEFSIWGIRYAEEMHRWQTLWWSSQSNWGGQVPTEEQQKGITSQPSVVGLGLQIIFRGYFHCSGYY